MRWLGTIVGVLFVLVGVVWIGQGVGLLPGSFMSGQPAYAVLGLMLAAVGGGILYASSRSRRTGRV